MEMTFFENEHIRAHSEAIPLKNIAYGHLRSTEFEQGVARGQPHSSTEVEGYTQNCDFGPVCPNMVIRAQTPQKLKKVKMVTLVRKTLKLRFQRALNQPQGTL